MTRCVLTDLPIGVKGFIHEDPDGDPVIILNARYSHEMNVETYKHEEGHRRHHDLAASCDVDTVEARRHS